MKVAIVHDWFITFAGAERVVTEMLKCFPEADLFAAVDFLGPEDQAKFGCRPVTTTWVQSLPCAARWYRAYLPVMPFAIEQLDLRGYDVVISSSHAVAKGVLTGPDQLHISYVHSPMRYAWDLQHEYLPAVRRGPGAWLMRWLLHRLRVWDFISGQRPDVLIANSHYIARRIRKVWRRDASVIYPPVDVTAFTPGSHRESYYVTACRLVPYKRVDLAVAAFADCPERRLVVIGDGPELERLKAMATSNVTFLGWQPFEILLLHLRQARAFVFAGEEDFGILPVEAQACGTPVIAFGRGGLSETVRDLSQENPTGVLFHEQSSQAIHEAIEYFEENEFRFVKEKLVSHASMFSTKRFRDEFKYVVEAEWKSFSLQRGINS